MTNNITIRKGTLAEFETIYKDMLVQFPPEELKPQWAFEKMFPTQITKFMVLVRDAEIVGYFIFHEVGDIAMLDHIAVLKKFHSSGIGSFMLAAISKKYVHLKGMYLEVEPPNPRDPDTLLRIKFYEKCGLYRLDINYQMPAPYGKTVRMDVWFLNSENFTGRIDESQVKQAAKAVLKHAYACFESTEFFLQQLDCDAKFCTKIR